MLRYADDTQIAHKRCSHFAWCNRKSRCSGPDTHSSSGQLLTLTARLVTAQGSFSVSESRMEGICCVSTIIQLCGSEEGASALLEPSGPRCLPHTPLHTQRLCSGHAHAALMPPGSGHLQGYLYIPASASVLLNLMLPLCID